MSPDFVALPKAELHRHLEGSVRPETLVELARDVGLDLPRRELLRRTSMRGERPGFARFLSKFALFRGLYPSREWIERVAFEAAEDARRDGVVYLELRFSPAHFARRLRVSGEDVAAWIAAAARRSGLEIRFIATFGRDFTLRENEPTVRAVRGTDLFSGLDLAGDEARPAEPFRELFRKLDLPVTLHAGEAGGAAHVREAIERFGARRIGHGVRVLEDPRTLALARARGVHFELCLTSEIQTGAAPSWKRHPGLRMVREGLSVSLNTDDPSICGVRLSGEYGRALRSGWTEEELSRAAAAAAEAAFLPGSARARLARRLRSAWEGVRV
ncbi:MAG TPA: adenosine deaminase [Planctomycetota bacterium]|nr:adenosine deaminase [Planctomycetota bacterium]